MRRFAVAIALVASLLHSISLTYAATPNFKQPNAYAVVIGISQYREEVIPKVPYAVKDAEAVAQLLETQAGIPKSQIKLLTDSKATLADFRNHIGDWLRMRVKPNSTVYVYYAGHGTPNPKTGEAYLVPWEGHPDFPSGLYPFNEMYVTLNKLPAKEVVVLLDSCFSGATGRSVLAKGARPMVISVENPLLAGGKVVVLAAASGAQISSDYVDRGHGLFTYYLLLGLQGGADEDANGVITVEETYKFVKETVPVIATDRLNREQVPVLLPDSSTLGRRAKTILARVTPVERFASEFWTKPINKQFPFLDDFIYDPEFITLRAQNARDAAEVMDVALCRIPEFAALNVEVRWAVRNKIHERALIPHFTDDMKQTPCLDH